MKKKILYLTLFLSLFFLMDNVFAVEAAGELKYVSCGTGPNAVTDIPADIPRLTALFVTLLQIITPIVLIITGMIELTKSISAGNPDNINKSKVKLVKKFVAALMVFFIIAFTTGTLKLVSGNAEKATFVACMSCYLNNDCEASTGEDLDASKDGVEKYYCADFNYTECPETAPNGDKCTINNQICEIESNNSCESYMAENCPKTAPNGDKCKPEGKFCKKFTIEKALK